MLAMAFGIASLVFSIIAVFVPVFGVFIAGLSGILAWVSVGRAVFLGLAAVIINVLNIFLFSPTFLVLIALEASQRTFDQSKLLNLWMIVIAIQVVAVLLFIFNKILLLFLKPDLKSKESDQSTAYRAKEHGHQETSTHLGGPPEETYEGSTRPRSPTRLTRIIVKKTRGGRKESSEFWDDGIKVSPVADGANLKKNSRKYIFHSPLIAISLVVIALTGWGAFNYFNNGFKNVPLNRVYDNVTPAPTTTMKEKVSTPQAKSYAGGIYEPESNDEFNRKTRQTADEKIYSWKDKDGRVKFTNTNPPQNGQNVTRHPELSDGKDRTQVEIRDNQVYIPITIIHNSKKLETSLLVNSSFARSVLPIRIANFLKADLLSAKLVKTIDGGEIILEKRRLDLFKVGPHIEKDFQVITQEGKKGVTRGILGRDFLFNHPYSIDYEAQAIVWQ